MADKTYGLCLTLGNAPNTPHQIGTVPAVEPEPDLMTAEEARELAGKALDAALSKRGLSTEGKADEKRERLAEAVPVDSPGQPSIDVPGLYRPNGPTPVGGPGELPLDVARGFDRDERIPLELVEISAAEVDDAREQAAVDKQDARGGIIDAAGQKLADRERAKDEAAALAAVGGEG